MMSTANGKHPNERPGLRYRRSLGESLTREMDRLKKDDADAPLAAIFVDFNARDGKRLVTLALNDAMHALQFNVAHNETAAWEDAYEAFVWIREENT
jgi:hypothetical protein